MNDPPSGSIPYAVAAVAMRVLPNLRAGEGVASQVPQHTDTTAHDWLRSSIECQTRHEPVKRCLTAWLSPTSLGTVI
jgi:hypothetical protein